MKLEDLNLPSLEQLSELEDPVLRFFDDDEHVIGDDCPCYPTIHESVRTKGGLVLVHHKYNLVPRSSLCFPEQ
jgi:hypothetical protein